MARVIESNLSLTGLAARAAVHTGEVDAVAPRLKRGATLVLADPPYDDREEWRVLEGLAGSPLVDGKNGTIAVEHSAKDDAPATLNGFRLRKTIKHGDGAVAIYVAADDN
jgi:16S rRNA G966 N2-methylase RsmD